MTALVDRFEDLSRPARRRLVAFTVMRVIAVVTLIVTAYYVMPLTSQVGGVGVVVRMAISLSALIAGTAIFVRAVHGARFPVLRAAEALAAVLAFGMVTFASTYVLLSVNHPAAFSEPLGHTDALYFSVTTSTTVGYGDIHPRTDPARIVVMLHMVTNVMVLGVAARLLLRTAQKRTGSG